LRAQARLLDLAHEAIIVRDNSDRIFYWNNGAQRLYGYTQQEAKGEVAHELLQAKFPQSRDDTQRQLHAAGFWQGEVIQTTKDGRLVHVESRWQSFASDGKLFTLESDFDLSYQQAAQLARAWEEKAKLIADMSHEINNPLTVALSATYLLKRTFDGTQECLWPSLRHDHRIAYAGVEGIARKVHKYDGEVRHACTHALRQRYTFLPVYAVT
jgi:PAS domain S-box-containing protein